MIIRPLFVSYFLVSVYGQYAADMDCWCWSPFYSLDNGEYVRNPYDRETLPFIIQVGYLCLEAWGVQCANLETGEFYPNGYNPATYTSCSAGYGYQCSGLSPDYPNGCKGVNAKVRAKCGCSNPGKFCANASQLYTAGEATKPWDISTYVVVRHNTSGGTMYVNYPTTPATTTTTSTTTTTTTTTATTPKPTGMPTTTTPSPTLMPTTTTTTTTPKPSAVPTGMPTTMATTTTTTPKPSAVPTGMPTASTATSTKATGQPTTTAKPTAIPTNMPTSATSATSTTGSPTATTSKATPTTTKATSQPTNMPTAKVTKSPTGMPSTMTTSSVSPTKSVTSSGIEITEEIITTTLGVTSTKVTSSGTADQIGQDQKASSGSEPSLSMNAIIGIAVGGAVLLLLCLAICCIIARRRRSKNENKYQEKTFSYPAGPGKRSRGDTRSNRSRSSQHNVLYSANGYNNFQSNNVGMRAMGPSGQSSRRSYATSQMSGAGTSTFGRMSNYNSGYNTASTAVPPSRPSRNLPSPPQSSSTMYGSLPTVNLLNNNNGGPVRAPPVFVPGNRAVPPPPRR